MNEIEVRMDHYFRNAPWQKRALVSYPILCAVARRRAEDMVERNYFSHVDPDGLWPNKHVRDAGWRLPPKWADDSNQIESLASGYLSPETALDALERSKYHHDHIVGDGFWSNHFCFGVGYAEDIDDTPERIYVVITSPLEKKIHSTYLPWITGGAQ